VVRLSNLLTLSDVYTDLYRQALPSAAAELVTSTFWDPPTFEAIVIRLHFVLIRCPAQKLPAVYTSRFIHCE